MPLDPQVVAAGKETFRHDTFGDETFWTDVLQMNKVIQAAVDPLTAASVGLKSTLTCCRRTLSKAFRTAPFR